MEELAFDMNATRLKKRAETYENFSSSKQRFDQLRFFQAINGNLVLRGREGRPDKIFRLDLAWKRFCTWYSILKRWYLSGFQSQCEQLKLVVEEMGAKIQECIAQRVALNEVPQWFTPKKSEWLGHVVQHLKKGEFF